MLGGLTTFITMAYIIVVDPQILSQAGMPAEGVVFATCLAAAVATLVMGLYANYPIALAPGMSLNAYFTYTVCIGMHVAWPTALGAVFFSGVLFVLLTVTRVREQIVNGIPLGLKHATAGGIGMFIAFVGLRSAKLVVADSATVVRLGNSGDGGVGNSSRAGAFAGTLGGAAESFVHVSEDGFAGSAAPGAGGNYFHFSVCGFVRQRGHDGGRVRAGRIREGRKDSARGADAHGGWDWNDGWGDDGDVDGEYSTQK